MHDCHEEVCYAVSCRRVVDEQTLRQYPIYLPFLQPTPVIHIRSTLTILLSQIGIYGRLGCCSVQREYY